MKRDTVNQSNDEPIRLQASSEKVRKNQQESPPMGEPCQASQQAQPTQQKLADEPRKSDQQSRSEEQRQSEPRNKCSQVRFGDLQKKSLRLEADQQVSKKKLSEDCFAVKSALTPNPPQNSSNSKGQQSYDQQAQARIQEQLFFEKQLVLQQQIQYLTEQLKQLNQQYRPRISPLHFKLLPDLLPIASVIFSLATVRATGSRLIAANVVLQSLLLLK